MSKAKLEANQIFDKKEESYSDGDKRKNWWKSKSRSRKFLFILSMLLLSGIVTNMGFRIYAYENINGTAEWKTTNGQEYLDIYAQSSYDLGYLTGRNLGTKILFLKLILQLMAPSFETSYEELRIRAQNYLPYIPEEQIQEMNGMAKGATFILGFPISFDDILVQNTFLDTFYGQIIPENLELMLGCTAIASNNSEESIVFGQNFDFNKIFSLTTSFVKHQISGKQAVFGVRFGGTLNLPLAKNEHGVSSLITVIRTVTKANYTIPTTSRIRCSLEDSLNASQLLNTYLIEYGPEYGAAMSMIVADEEELYKVYINPNNKTCELVTTAVTTNTFTDLEWQQYLHDPEYSKERQSEAENQLTSKLTDGILEHAELLEILGSEPIICQTASDLISVETLAFFTSQYFGLGSPNQGKYGEIPL